MRFSETLRFNANPDWWVYYIPYDELKLHVAELRELHHAVFFSTAAAQRMGPAPSSPSPHDDSTDDEADLESASPRRAVPASPIRRSASRKVLADMRAHSRAVGYGAALEGLPKGALRSDGDVGFVDGVGMDPVARFEERDALFFVKLDKHANMVDELFKRLSNELKQITSEIRRDADRLSANVTGQVEETPLLNAGAESSLEYVQSRDATEAELRALRSRLVEHYKELGETVNFSTLNRTGFDKILKKHDKYTTRHSRASFMAKLLRDMSFTDTAELEVMQMQIEKIYADVFKQGDARAGKEELREGLRDLIVWDRNTIWRDILRTERKVSAFHSVKGGENFAIQGVPAVVLRPKAVPVIAAILAFILIICFPRLVYDLPVQEGGSKFSDQTLDAAHRCLALVACVVILWAWDGVPLYVASFLVLPGVVLLRVFLDEKTGAPLGTHEAAQAVFTALSSDTILLIICVYTLGAALSKFEIDKLAATMILSKIQRPGFLLCALMFLAVFVSIFVSNVAAPVLLNSVMMPTIDAMRHSESNRIYVRCLLLGIMVASNIGGFASPISSPQSAVALGLLTGEYKISFVKWLVVAIPQCTVMVLACFSVLYFWYKPHRYVLPPLPRFSEALTWAHWVIITTIAITVLLWSDHDLQDLFGTAGVVAVIPVLVFFGSGILSKEDFNNLPWDVVYLVAGGTVLGAAVQSCKLLNMAAERLRVTIGESNVLGTYLIFCVFMALVANAVSHTVSAIIVLPLVKEVGVKLGHPQLLVLGATFAASSAMALPISSFPNISATQVEDEKGEPYLTSGDVLRVGTVMTVIATAVLLTFGYQLMIGLNL